MLIQVLGLGHVKSDLTIETIRQVLLEEGIDIKVEKVTGCKNIASYGVHLTPSVMINGDVKCTGHMPTKEEVRGWITNTIKKSA
jgi:small redox-active disulfide protein 2